MQDLITDFAKICISPRPTGSPIAKAHLTVINEFEHQARQNTPLASQLPSLGLHLSVT